MRNIFLRIFLTAASAAAALAAGSCNGPQTASDEELFLQQPSVCMFVGTKEYIGPSFGTLQTSNNSQNHTYRAGIPLVLPDKQTGRDVEVVEEYYVLVLDAVPGAEGSVVNGKLDLKSDQLRDGYQTYTDMVFTVKKVQENLVWLWDSENHLGVVIQAS